MLILILLFILSHQSRVSFSAIEDARVDQWLRAVNDQLSTLASRFVRAKWDYETNITAETSRVFLDAGSTYEAYERSLTPVLMQFDSTRMNDSSLRRQIEKMQKYVVNNQSLWSEEESSRQRSLTNSMISMFNTKSICSWQGARSDFCSQRWQFDPDILVATATQRDYDVLAYVWKSWRDAIGPDTRLLYLEDVELRNRKARAIGFADWGALWRSMYEMEDFEAEANRLFYEILPLYEQLHAYVRRRLKETYRGRFDQSATMPVHIMGNVMGEEWSNIYRYTLPFPGKPYVDVTRTMQAAGYDQIKLYRLADSFYTSMGMRAAPDSFWSRSIFARIPDRRMVCHATSWDMLDGDGERGDTRVRVCAKVSQYDLLIAHHEMGHVQYFMQYARLPPSFREPANPGFHEAIGDTIALAASTRRHMETLGLLTPSHGRLDEDDSEADLNWLYKQALFKIPFLIFSYFMDSWRWRVFDGTVRDANLNSAWWSMYKELMGLHPPYPRNESDFDAAAKSHVLDGTEFARYFVSGVIQFQFYESMCQASGYNSSEKSPLHRCDFYSSLEAGRRLSSVLELGSSQHWTRAMERMTGQTRMSARSLVSYFRPLHEWLRRENAKTGECFGWGQVWPDTLSSTLSSPRC